MRHYAYGNIKANTHISISYGIPFGYSDDFSTACFFEHPFILLCTFHVLTCDEQKLFHVRVLSLGTRQKLDTHSVVLVLDVHAKRRG